MSFARNEDSPRQRARQKACRQRGGDGCPCFESECRLHEPCFNDIFPNLEIRETLFGVYNESPSEFWATPVMDTPGIPEV